MDIRIIYLINLILWLWVVYILFQSKKVTLKLRTTRSYILTVIFFIIGIIMYLKTPNHIMILNFISFACAGFCLDNCPGGFTSDGIFLFGKIHRYQQIKNFQLEDKGGSYRLKFKSNKKDYYLYLDNVDIVLVKEYLSKIRREND